MAADHILLCQPGPGSQRTPIKFSATMTVHEMLGVQYYPNAMNILYFEVLSMTLQEFESKQFVRISYLDGALKEQGPLDLFVFKTASLGQVLEEVFGQIKRDVHGSGRARFYEVVNSRIYRWPSLDDPVHSIPSSSQLYVEDIPEEELSMGSGDRLVNVIHYTRDVLRGHGVPFQFVLKGVGVLTLHFKFKSHALYLGRDVCGDQKTATEPHRNVRQGLCQG